MYLDKSDKKSIKINNLNILKLTELVGDPEVIKNIEEWKKYTKELSDMEEVVDKYKEYVVY